MNKKYLVFIGLVILFTLACSLGGASAEPKAPLAPIFISGNLSTIDLCKAIPVKNIEDILGRKLVKPPERFEYYDATGSNGCSYDAEKDSGGNAYFAYIAFTPGSVYENQPLFESKIVDGLGQSAYFNNGPDARQLWVRIDNDLAFVVAFGDKPNESGAMDIARLLIDAIK